jgi:serine protease inhibitor
MLKTSSNADNLVFSPSSMNILLAMLRKGTRGIAGNELRTTLELTGIPDSTINEGYSEYLQSFPVI